MQVTRLGLSCLMLLAPAVSSANRMAANIAEPIGVTNRQAAHEKSSAWLVSIDRSCHRGYDRARCFGRSDRGDTDSL